MVKIPTIDSSAQLNDPATTRVDEQLFTAGGKTFSEVGKQLNETVLQFKKIRDYNEVASSELDAREKITAIKSQAFQDPNPENYPIYQQKIDEAVATSLNNVTDNIARAELGNKLSLHVFSEYSDISNNFRQKAIQIAQGNYIQMSNKYETDEAMATNDVDRQKAKSSWEDLFNRTAASGIYAADDLAKMRIAHEKSLEDTKKALIREAIYNETATTEESSALLKEFTSGKNERFNAFDVKEKLSLVKELKARIFQNNQTYKRDSEIIKNDRFQNVFKKKLDNNLTLQDIEDERIAAENGVQGALDQKEILGIKEGLIKSISAELKALTEPTGEEEGNAKAIAYRSAIDRFIDDETTRQRGHEILVNAFRDGGLSAKETVYLNSLKRAAEDIGNIRGREEFMNNKLVPVEFINNKLVPLKNAINSINDFFTGKKNYTEMDKMRVIKELINHGADGGDVQLYTPELLKKAILEKNPTVLLLNPEGQLVVDDNGNIKIMNNKGEIREVEGVR